VILSLQNSIGENSNDALYESAYRTLRRAILTGLFEPGEKITIRNLANTLGLSTMPAREALRRLVAEKGLELPHNRRSVRVPILSIARMNELWRVRLALEGLAAEVAGAKSSSADIEEIALIQMRLAAARKSQDFTAIMLNNFDFHHALYQLANMPYLLSLIESLWLNVGPLLSKLYGRGRGTQLRDDAHHAEVIKALRNADPLGVRRAVERDIEQALPHLLEIVSSLSLKNEIDEPVIPLVKKSGKTQKRIV